MPEPQSPVLRVTVDDKQYDIDFSDLTAIDSKAFRHAVGIPLASVLANTQDGDLDVIAGLVWLHRRKNGEPSIAYDTVAASIKFTSTLDIGDAEAEADAPEA